MYALRIFITITLSMIFMILCCSCSLVNAASSGSSRNSFASYRELQAAIEASLWQHEQKAHNQNHSRSKRSVKRVCYDELGCFEDSGPFAYLEMLPSSPEEINTKFYFYSTRNRSDRPLMELPFRNMTDAFHRKSKRESKLIMGQSRTTAPQTMGGTNRLPTTAAPEKSSTTTSAVYKKPTLTIDQLEGFDELSVRVIVHGFGSACRHSWIYEIKTALMAVEDCIVICVNWENGATFPNYVRAAANTRLVGKQLAMLLRNLQEHKGLNLTRTHIIGFSLGAHVSGFAGAELPGLSRITGLDPAGPLFEAQHPKVRLDSNDAEFVDVIHSNGENLILGGLGSWQPMGHVDYYPNGGRVQTGCSNLFVGAVTDFIWSAQTAEDEEGRSLCNHRRAYKFFIDSVAPRCLFPAFPCANYDDFLKGKCFPCAQDDEDLAEGVPRCGNMGYYADRSTGRGQLYLLTREEEPFCAHQFQLQIFNSFNDLPLRTIGRLEAILEGDGGLNETFEISEKDDAEFFAGDIVSKIIVPHPALGFPTTLSLHYKSYAGWLSKGLPHWDIDKVVLTDSFGRSHALCKPTTKLSSGTPVRLVLQPGNCELDNQDEYGAYTTPLSPVTDVPDSSIQETAGVIIATAADSIESVKQSKDIFNLGTSFRLAQNQTFPLEQTDELPWQPILEGNSLDKEVGESSRSLSGPDEPQAEIFEPILKDRRATVNRGRNLQDSVGSPTEEILEPVLKATTPRVKKAKEMPLNDEPSLKITSPTSTSATLPDQLRNKSDIIRMPVGDSKSSNQMPAGEPVTVQLLPFRLGELLQRAERYARETLLPLISVQAPRFFGFNVTMPTAVATTTTATEGASDTVLSEVQFETSHSESRKPRYIPRYEEAAFLTDRKQSDQMTISAQRNSPMHQRNLFKFLRLDRDITDVAAIGARKLHMGKRPTNSDKTSQVTYYTNTLKAESRSLRPEDPDYEPVFIQLPTYRPPKAGRRSRSID